MIHKIIVSGMLSMILISYSEAQILGPVNSIGGDTCIFDEPCNFITIDPTQVNNLWQIGKPLKTVFDTAYMGTLSIITDSINAYDTSTISSFTMQLVHPNTTTYEIVFWHRYDTDQEVDGGYIEMSYDMGLTWTNIIDNWSYPLRFQSILMRNLYGSEDTITSGQSGYSGSLAEWTKVEIAWNMLLEGGIIDEKVNRDTTLMRFTFVSDSIDNGRDGWCIDNIVYLIYDTYDNVEIIRTNNLVKLYPNPATDIIHFESNIPIVKIEIFNATGNTVAAWPTSLSTLSIANLARGMYFVVFYLANSSILTEKFIKY